jgi:bacillolysin
VRPAPLSRGRLLGVAAVSLAMLAPALPAAAASSSATSAAYASGAATRARSAAASASRGSAVTIRRDQRGHAHYVGAAAGRVLARSTARGQSPAAAARANLGRYAADFGISSPARDLRTDSVQALAKGQSVVRFQQTANGLPVFGGQLTSVLNSANDLLSVTGETSTAVGSSTYSVTARAARTAALRVAGADHGLGARALLATPPQQWLFDPSLFDATSADGARPVWRFEVTARDYLDVRELVLVDGGTGRVLMHVDEIEHADRVVCDNAGKRDDVYRCAAPRYKRTETGPPSGVDDVNSAFVNAGAASDFYASLGVDLTALIGSDFGDGKKIRSTVRVCPTSGTCPYDNAFWDGSQMVYGGGFAQADDVVAHELSHGVTQHTSGLIYWYQSGAINESMSDVFGELVDLSDHIGNDDPSVRWVLGEDLPGDPATKAGLERNLQNPPAHLQPDRVDGQYWTTLPADSGGVHTNSGVGNKAAYLITDGTVNEPPVPANGWPAGTFNGQTIVGLGEAKAAQIYLRTEQMLTPGADYGDLANTLLAACSGLAAAGIAGIVATDCTTVTQATQATQMQAFSGPSEPQNVTILGGYHEIRVLWSPPASSGTAGVTSYVLAVNPPIQGEDFLPIDNPDTHDVTIGGIPAGVTFTFGLIAVSTEGNSPPVPLTLEGTRLSLSTAPSVPLKKHARLSGQLSLTTGVGVGGRRVRLYRRLAGQHGYHPFSSARTSSVGAFTFQPLQARKASYFVSFASNVSGLLGSRSSTHTVTVRRNVSLRADHLSVRVGRPVHFSGRVSPQVGGTVTLQRRVLPGAAWSRVASDQLDSHGRFRLVWTPRSHLDFAWRVVGPKPVGRKSLALGRGFSRTVVVQVA